MPKKIIIKSEFVERKSFMKKRIAVKFKELIYVLLSEQASSPYSNIGKHLLFTRVNNLQLSEKKKLPSDKTIV